MKTRHLVAAGLLSLAAGAAVAAPVTVQSYSMANGHGKASGGWLNYWDKCYGGVCDKTTDGQLLAGGTGDLTDDVVGSRSWGEVESVAGTGPYVAWPRDGTSPVSIDFFFDGTFDIDSLALHADDADGKGGVSLPGSVLVTWAGGSASFAVDDPTGVAPRWLVYSGLGIGGVSQVNVQLTHRTWWIFVDEVRFTGSPPTTRQMDAGATNGQAVPEPASLSLALAALALAGQSLRRRRVG